MSFWNRRLETANNLLNFEEPKSFISRPPPSLNMASLFNSSARFSAKIPKLARLVFLTGITGQPFWTGIVFEMADHPKEQEVAAFFESAYDHCLLQQGYKYGT